MLQRTERAFMPQHSDACTAAPPTTATPIASTAHASSSASSSVNSSASKSASRSAPTYSGSSSSTVAASALTGLGPGAIGGVCNVLAGHPIDLIKVRVQTATPPIAATSGSGGGSVGVASMLRSIVRAQGVPGLYAGVTAPLVAVVPAFAVSFASYEWALRRTQQQQQQRDTTATNVTLAHITTAGAVSGFCLALIVGPMERIKCLMQVQKKPLSFLGTIAQCYRRGGIPSLVRGTGLTILRDIPGNAAYFGSSELTRRCFSKEYRSSIGVTLLAGGMAGVGNWIVAIPFDVIKSRWQTGDHYRSVRHCFSDLMEQEGPAGLIKGLRPSLIRAFPANAACLLGFETTKTCLEYCGYTAR